MKDTMAPDPTTTAAPAAPPRLDLAWLYLGLVLAAVWVFHVLSSPVWADGTAEGIHTQVVTGLADYPHQFRPLVPWLCELATRAHVPLKLAYLLQTFVFWFLAVLWLHQYLRAWLPELLCLAGGLILVALLPFSTIAQGFQPTDPLNLFLFVLAYHLLAQRRDAALPVLVAVGMLNRETIGLVALLAAAVRCDEVRSARYWWLVLGLAGEAAVIYLALHAYYGSRPSFTPLITPAQNVPYNLHHAGSLRAVVLYGVLWLLAVTGLRGQPAFLRRSVVLIPVFLLVHLCVGLLGETRYFLPLAPTVIPLGLRRLYPEEPAR